jgi:hypothetical protein
MRKLFKPLEISALSLLCRMEWAIRECFKPQSLLQKYLTTFTNILLRTPVQTVLYVSVG